MNSFSLRMSSHKKEKGREADSAIPEKIEKMQQAQKFEHEIESSIDFNLSSKQIDLPTNPIS